MSKYVCSRCFDDPYIQDFIEWSALAEECSYCEETDDGSFVARFSDVAEFMLEKLQTEFDDAANWLPWESAEGGWQGTTFDTRELLTDTLGLGLESEELLDDLSEAFGDIDWCERNPFDLTQDQDLRFEWKRFCHQIKHEVRHVFFRIPEDVPSAVGSRITRSERSPQPYEVLYRIGQLVNELGSVRTYDPGERFFRVRLHDRLRYSTVRDVGPPPENRARYSNRFSPAGIPMFYGALDECTAISETYDYENSPINVATIGVFENLVPLRILDLTELPLFPSIFDDLSVSERDLVRFLHYFVRACTRRIEKDGREHVSYVPTQVVTEYFRHIFRTNGGDAIHGILYPTATGTGGISCVLFLTSVDCTEDGRVLSTNFGTRQATLSLITSATSYRTLP